MYGDASFITAEDQLVADIQRPVMAENANLQGHVTTLRQSNTALQQTIESLHRELGVARSARDDFDVHRCLRAAEDELTRAHESGRRKDAVIRDLQDQVRRLTYGSSPKRRRIRQFSRSRSRSRSYSPSPRRPRSHSRSRRYSRSRSPAPERPRSHSRPHSAARVRSRSRALSRRASRPASPMLEDSRASLPPPPYLLSRMDLQSPAPLSAAPTHPGPPALPSSSGPPSSAIPLSTGASLASRISSTTAPVPVGGLAAFGAADLPFPAQLPVIYYSRRSYEWTAALPDGSLNFEASLFFVYADACVNASGGGGYWRTSLVPQWRLRSTDARSAIAAGTPLPHSCFFTGGRNGVLISDRDPTTEAGVADLFATNHKHGVAYIDRVQNTPYHLREQCHQEALDRWLEQRDQKRRELEERGEGPIPKEPSPHDHNGAWRRWLNDMNDHPRLKDTKILGLPRVCDNYLSVHMEGTRAVLALLPQSPKGRKAVPRNKLRWAFLGAVAALVGVPERYKQTVVRLGISIAQERRSRLYDPAHYGSDAQLGINEATRFLADIGVSLAEAESWRPWAAAYIAMELERQPEGVHAQQFVEAQQLARERIDGNPRWVLNSLHTSTPGYYNPACGRARATHQAVRDAPADALGVTPEAGSSSHVDNDDSSATGGGPSLAAIEGNTQGRVMPDDDEREDAVSLHDEDTRMGPA